MPADRRIAIHVSATGTRNDHGEYEPGDTEVIPAWASRRDASIERKIEEGGNRNDGRRTWRVRWDARYVGVAGVYLDVIDEGVRYGILNQSEVTRQRGGQDLRRRFIDLEGTFSI